MVKSQQQHGELMVKGRKKKISCYFFTVLIVIIIFDWLTSRGIFLKTTSIFNLKRLHSALKPVIPTVRIDGEQQPKEGVLPKSNKQAVMKAGDLFVPGSLNLTRLEALQKCYIDPVRYKQHRRQFNRVFISAEHDLVYSTVPKSGSSYIRKNMEKLFDATIKICKNVDFDQATFLHFSFSREPLSRFISSFQEVMLRWRVFEKPPKKLEGYLRHYQNASLKIDHDEILNALEVFVLEHYDGYHVLNLHLTLQAPQLTVGPYYGCPHLDVIHDLMDVDTIMTKFAMQRNINSTLSDAKRAKKLRLDKSRLSVEAQRKICQVSALDYCCLNYQLPPICEGALSCRWRAKNVNNLASLSSYSVANNSAYNLLIEAVSTYPILPQLDENWTGLHD